MHSTWIRLGSIAGFFGVAAGAFGAHALQGRVDDHLVEVFATGSRYALVHGVALVGVGALCLRRPVAALRVSAIAFAAGVLLFSGSLWTMALTGQRWLGAVTPVGGLCLLVGWASLAIAAGRLAGPGGGAGQPG